MKTKHVSVLLLVISVITVFSVPTFGKGREETCTVSCLDFWTKRLHECKFVAECERFCRSEVKKCLTTCNDADKK